MLGLVTCQRLSGLISDLGEAKKINCAILGVIIGGKRGWGRVVFLGSSPWESGRLGRGFTSNAAQNSGMNEIQNTFLQISAFAKG
ncbi:hypothetical protein DWB84_10625 [Saccharophagus sp. K07]|nr:hypothetical protein [Saccharophagus sp. K07]